MKVYERTENGTATQVSVKDGLAEINDAMMAGKREVRTMSSISRTDYAIEYKDGRSVRLVQVDTSAPEGYTTGQAVVVRRPGQDPIAGTVDHIHTAPGYVAVRNDRHRSTAIYPASFVSAVEVEAEEEPTDSAPWTVASHRTLLHKFTEASAAGRAVCNKSFRPWLYGNGYVFKTRAEHEASRYADLYTFCPRCESK
ncbi:hypothetical protein [Streptomyces sp. SID2119]|uniref:hypothetical protein n=1 Tax=Streptomyces sp. SID2119 TaxID=2690253 RepID=UPI001368C38B|nr:hypothetical protein [Streptomyces sp. SID2119]MYW28209.1 hypothetical protein [Streptomyces sp. SID2119]MYW29683.1 hypothetical protein [Streptomyces sp. SID2119]